MWRVVLHLCLRHRVRNASASEPQQVASRWDRRRWLMGGSAGLLLSATGCTSRAQGREVVAYVALDAEFSQPILGEFERTRGIDVRAVFDVESTKTVGLVNRLIAERRRTRCDLFWNNEILHTLRLKKLGMLQPFEPPRDYRVPDTFRDPQGQWYGFAARARVFLVRKNLPSDTRPTSIQDLAEPKGGLRPAMARPLFGTTATHAAVLFSQWGKARATKYYRAVLEKTRIYSGNRQVAEAVGRGEVDFGITDTDDAIVQIEKGSPVEVIFPDQGESDMGTLFIPNTVCMLRGAPHRSEAQELARFLLSSHVETRLARGPSAQIPLRQDVSTRSRIAANAVRPAAVDFERAAGVWPEAMKVLGPLFR